jgi:aminoglycoside 3-N-acetyltransferase
MSKVDFLAELVRPAKRWLRSPYQHLRMNYMRWCHGFGSVELLSALRKLGVRQRDAILVHSGMEGFAGWKGTIPEIVSVFEEAVGPGGTLLMPTFSVSGSAVDFVKRGLIFDPRLTPSRTGLLTEVFRRSAGVVRSVHPTHSVAVWGTEKDWWIENHHLAGTPCGRATPFYRLWERDGKIVFAGVDISTMAFFHCAEELLEPVMPFSPFTSERYTMSCRLDGGAIQTAPTRLYAPEVSRRRCLRPLEAELKRKHLWHEGRVGSLTIVVLAAVEVLGTLKEMADRGVFCYGQ